jgi:uncharacterized membrane protein YccC
MAATSYPNQRQATPTRGWLEAGLVAIRAELAIKPHRVRSAIRSATLGALGAGLMAAAHVDSPLGPYIVWLLAGSPTAMMRWRNAVAFTLVTGATLSASIVLGRVLSQSPTLMLATIAVFGAASTYVTNHLKFRSFGLVTQVLVLDDLYSVMFAPDQVGWAAAATFGGVVIGVLLIVLFDNWLWRDPAEAILLESLADDLQRVRKKLIDNTRHYLMQDRPPPAPIEAHEMAADLTLLARAQAEGLTERRRSVLLGALTRLSRLRSLTNDLAVVANEAVAREVRQLVASAINDAVDALVAALEALAANPSAMLRTGPDQPPTPVVEQMRDALAALDARVLAIRPLYLDRNTGAAELSNLASFLASLHGVGRLLERPLDEPPSADAPAQRPAGTATLDPVMVRYGLKVAICLVIGYIIGLTSQRPDLSTILTTVIITALPTYGAAARKMILRVVGAILGGLVVIAMVIITSPNFETLPVYVIAIFVVLVVSGYAGQSSGRVAYAGTQLGTTMMLAFAGLSPSLAVEAPLWRIWSILLGTGVVLMVFTILWPEYASVALQPRLRQLMRLTLGLAPGVAEDVATIRRLDAELSGALEQTLAIADDARLEGGASRLDADAVVETAGTLRRIAHRFAGIALGRILHPRPRLDPATEEAARLALEALVSQLQVWLSWVDRPLSPANPPPRAQETRAAATQALGELTSRIEADRFARIADWGLEQRRTLLTELASLQRLSVLLGELDEYLARVLRARSARPR